MGNQGFESLQLSNNSNSWNIHVPSRDDSHDNDIALSSVVNLS